MIFYCFWFQIDECFDAGAYEKIEEQAVLSLKLSYGGKVLLKEND